MTRLLVTRPIPDEGIKMLRRSRKVVIDQYKPDRVMPREELLRRARKADVILSILTDKMDAELFNAAPRLKMIANYAVGFDNIDLKEAKKRGITVAHTRYAGISESVAEHAIGLMLALAHRLVEADRFMRDGKYEAWGPRMLLGADLIGKTVGVIGTGAIGTGIIRRLHDGFGVKVVYNDVKRNQTLEETMDARFLSKDALLKTADFISLHVPLLPSTRHMIGARELKLMKKTAFLINTSRGPVVDAHALTRALARRQIGGAGLDVYECEPNVACDAKDSMQMIKLPNVVLTPHTASATIETRQAMSRAAARNILAFLEGKTPPDLVDA